MNKDRRPKDITLTNLIEGTIYSGNGDIVKSSLLIGLPENAAQKLREMGLVDKGAEIPQDLANRIRSVSPSKSLTDLLQKLANQR